MTAYARIEALLKHRIGLDAATIGAGNVERAVRARMAACRISDPQAYRAYLDTAEPEVQELIEAVVVPETWFFRDREAYAELVRIVREQWLPAHPAATLKVLSVPSATGEEPYSIAMALIDAGVPAARWRIDAADVSARVIAYALRARYGRNSFRGTELGYRDRHFVPVEGGFRLCQDVCSQVRFRQGNLLAADFPFALERYDAIFCRNLLIYFDRPTQDMAIRVLHGLLAAQALLFVGSSEAGLLLDHGWTSVQPRAFAFRTPLAGKAGPEPPRPAVRTPVRPKPRAPATAAPPPSSTPVTPRASISPRPAPPSEPASVPPLAAACHFADRGNFAEAARLCEQHLRRHGPAAQAYYLLGLVREAAGEPQDAEGYYRKALYLEPNHEEALAHLALFKAAQGDEAAARRLRERIQRLQAQKERP